MPCSVPLREAVMATDDASIIEQIADPNVPISKLRNKVTVDP
jgi:hypothetical protein